MSKFQIAIWMVAATFAADRAGADDKALALAARDVLKTSCHSCHKGPGSRGGRFNAVIYDSLIKAEAGEEAVVVPKKKLEDSSLWQQVESGEMPKKASPERATFGPKQKDILKQWIEAGAPAWDIEQVPQRTFISTAKVLESIRDYLRAQKPDDRRFLRFYTLTHLHNEPVAKVENEHLDLYRAALSKAINSLSWRKNIVIPQAVDPNKTVFAVDLRSLDWDKNEIWKTIVSTYPYGLVFNNPKTPQYQDPYNEIASMTGVQLPFIRADWFVAVATRPPLYHKILQLPDRADQLEAQLRINVTNNFLIGSLARAGFAKSKVSIRANRMIERHETPFGAYWKSYDFRANQERNELPQFPLGPAFPQNPFPNLAFQQAGGEIVFNLPNGLQAYLLINAKDERIDIGPSDVVSDPDQVGGSAEIINGLSCMACHAEGMKADFKDEIRVGSVADGAALAKVEQLYPKNADMVALVNADRTQFLTSLQKCVQPFLKPKPGDKAPLGTLPEPVAQIARFYSLDDLDAPAAAAELGLPSADALLPAIRLNPALRTLGLAPLANGGHVKRAVWEQLPGRGTSIMQRAARELGEGTPWSESD